jgi:uncharacterized protein (DUF952 family)
MSERVYHITSASDAEAAARTGDYIPRAFSSEGFVHCSYRRQLVAVANARFRGRVDLVLLEIDRARLSCRVIDENLEGGSELFPHVYGPLPMSAVVQVHRFPCMADGCFELPPALLNRT